jgi:hypothetical protein
MSDLSEVRASLARAQQELDAAHERLSALDASKSKTALIPSRSRRRLRPW